MLMLCETASETAAKVAPLLLLQLVLVGCSSTTAAREPLQPAKVSMYGDSTAVVVGVGLADVDQEQNLIQSVDGGAWLGCGLGRGGQLRSTDKPVILRTTTAACMIIGMRRRVGASSGTVTYASRRRRR